MAEKLKQCPFCGSDAKYNEKLEAVFCHGCDAMRTGYKHKKGSAILEWNRRPQIKEKNLNSAGIDTCPCCGGSVKVLERSLEHWGGMKCESISLPCGSHNISSDAIVELEWVLKSLKAKSSLCVLTLEIEKLNAVLQQQHTCK